MDELENFTVGFPPIPAKIEGAICALCQESGIYYNVMLYAGDRIVQGDKIANSGRVSVVSPFSGVIETLRSENHVRSWPSGTSWDSIASPLITIRPTRHANVSGCVQRAFRDVLNWQREITYSNLKTFTSTKEVARKTAEEAAREFEQFNNAQPLIKYD